MKTPRFQPFSYAGWLPLLAFFALFQVVGSAQTPPNFMTYQGYLTDGNGNPLGSTNSGPKAYSVAFEIFTGPTSATGTNVFGELQTVTVDNGFFSVLLGQGGTYNSEAHALSGNVFANPSNLYIQMTVLGIGTGGVNVTILPRLQLVSSPYAFAADTANTLVNSQGSPVITSTENNVIINQLTASNFLASVISAPAISAATLSAATLNATNVFAAAVSAGTVSAGGALNGGALQISNFASNSVVIGGQWLSNQPALTLGVNNDPHLGTSTEMQAWLSYGTAGNLPGYMLLNPNGGYVGIGTLSPNYPLDVEETRNTSISAYEFLNGSGPGFESSGSGVNGFSIYAAGRVVTAQEFDVLSDARIKNIVSRSDTSKDLAAVRQLQITDYRKIDKVQYGSRLEKGVIAQEVEKIIPEAVSSSTNFIPDIYALPSAFSCTNGILRVALAFPHNLAIGDKVKLITESGNLQVTVTGIDSPLDFTAGNVPQAPRQLFVYGKQVSNLRDVNYDRLYTTGLGAIQELAKRLDAVEAREARLADLERQAARVNDLEQEIASLKHLVAQLGDARQAREQPAAAPSSPAIPAKVLTTASLIR